MGRKRIYIPTVIAVDSDGELITWVNGDITADKEIKKTIQFNSDIKLEVDLTLTGPTVEADLSPENHLGILAALMSVKPGRTRILDAPDDVLAQLPGVYKLETTNV
jgi:hypothetical protein